MSDRGALDERRWDPGWESHDVAQRRRLARLSLAEKLQWLEDAHRVVRSLERSRRLAAGGAPDEEP